VPEHLVLTQLNGFSGTSSFTCKVAALGRTGAPAASAIMTVNAAIGGIKHSAQLTVTTQ
jgi:hypothetical protein